jgi:hypothetical protein
VLRLTTLLRSFPAGSFPGSFLSGSIGNARAVANVRSVLEDRHREDWVVEGLLRRLDAAPATQPVVEPATAARVA